MLGSVSLSPRVTCGCCSQGTDGPVGPAGPAGPKGDIVRKGFCSWFFCHSACMFGTCDIRVELPPDVRIAESLTIFRKRLKTHLFRVHLDSP